MSAMLPHVNLEDDFVYLVSILRSAPPSCQHGSQCLDTLLSQNKKIIDIATSESSMQKTRRNNAVTQVEAASNFAGKTKNVRRGRFIEVKMVEDEGGMGAKQYLPYWKDEEEWKNHFGDMWDRFKELKNRFDPLNVLTPGQRIFQRIAN